MPAVVFVDFEVAGDGNTVTAIAAPDGSHFLRVYGFVLRSGDNTNLTFHDGDSGVFITSNIPAGTSEVGTVVDGIAAADLSAGNPLKVVSQVSTRIRGFFFYDVIAS